VSFLKVGISHEHASLDVLERVTISEEDCARALSALLSNANVEEAVLLSTCLRTEVYAVIDRFHGAVDEITATLAEHTGVSVEEITPLLSIQFDRGVPQHLFTVASGIKSVVPGEYEVLGQLRRALERADEEHAAGPELTELFQRAISTGRKVRHDTAIARGTTSFAQASVNVIEREVGEELRGATVVVVGAGQLASGIVKSLLGETFGIDRLVITNRTRERAETLRDELGDPRVQVVPLEEVDLSQARVLVTAVEAPEPFINASHVMGVTTSLLVVDLGVPRAVDVALDEHPLIRRLDMAHLHEVVESTLAERRTEITAAEGIVALELDKYLEDRRSRGAAAIVAQLRDSLEEIRVAELSRREADLADLSPEQRDRVESLTRSILAKIAHHPTMALKDAAGTDRGLRLNEALRTLFGLS
jgi:glutamyl-tRNA reductase